MAAMRLRQIMATLPATGRSRIRIKRRIESAAAHEKIVSPANVGEPRIAQGARMIIGLESSRECKQLEVCFGLHPVREWIMTPADDRS